MSRVTFYLLNSTGPSAEYFTCRLIDQVWNGLMPVHIHTSDETSCKHLDLLLWSWREDSFLPHGIISHMSDSTLEQRRLAEQSLITLGFDTPDTRAKQLLINLSAEVPLFFQSFSRVCEIVIDNNQHKAISRTKFRAYRKSGVEPQITDLSGLSNR